jgi:hypothetical protein
MYYYLVFQLRLLRRRIEELHPQLRRAETRILSNGLNIQDIKHFQIANFEQRVSYFPDIFVRDVPNHVYEDN